ncbi:MAG: cache domain-containing protein [Rhodospirillaceae bacterium]
MKLVRFIVALALPFALLTAAGMVNAADRGTAAEAKALLDKAVTAVKADEAKALAEFTADAKAKDGAFFQKDLYVFCGGADGNFSAHPSLIGKSMKGLMDKASPPMAVGEGFYKAAAAGGGEVTYTWPLPGGTEPMKKVAIVAPAGTQVCAVGYYP